MSRAAVPGSWCVCCAAQGAAFCLVNSTPWPPGFPDPSAQRMETTGLCLSSPSLLHILRTRRRAGGVLEFSAVVPFRGSGLQCSELFYVFCVFSFQVENNSGSCYFIFTGTRRLIKFPPFLKFYLSERERRGRGRVRIPSQPYAECRTHHRAQPHDPKFIT